MASNSNQSNVIMEVEDIEDEDMVPTSESIDIRGVKRGKCSGSACLCSGFIRQESRMVCKRCGHPPVKHQNLSSNSSSRVETDSSTANRTIGSLRRTNNSAQSDDCTSDDDGEEEMMDDEDEVMCSYRGCCSSAYFNVNTRESSPYCEKHKSRLKNDQGGLNPLFFNPSRVHGLLPTCQLPGCSNPSFVNPESGEAYECCSLSHGQQLQENKQRALFMSGQVATVTGVPPNMKCTSNWCDQPKYQKNGQVFDFCGISCRNLYNKFMKELQQGQHSAKGFAAMAQPKPPLVITHPSKLCILPGCRLPRYYDNSDGTWKSFCGKQHKAQAENLVLLELISGQEQYTKTLNHFIKQWNPRKSVPPKLNEVVTIFKIFNPKQKNIFDQYVKSLSSQTVERYYHGTSIKCDVMSSKAACSDQKCGVCGVSRRGFDIHLIGSNIPRFMRFGKGFYLAPNSSKCHDYTQGIMNYRVMLLCKVAPGNKYMVTSDQTTLNAPPQGYDSVYGASGGNLNYDEIVLYSSQAILPKYAVVYRRDGIQKIAK